MYDRLLKEYDRKSKEELFQEIQALKDIECSDRCFANECEAGSSIYDINELFTALNELRSELTKDKIDKIYEIMEVAEQSWLYIVNELSEMNNPYRFDKVLKDYKQMVLNAKNDNDRI